MNPEQERIALLEQKLAQQEEENFELQAAVAVAEAECQHKIQAVERTLQQTERNLRDQLRRSQHEANLVRAQSKQQQQQQRVPPTIVAPVHHPAPAIPPKAMIIQNDNTTKESCGIILARHLLLVDKLTPLAPILLNVVANNRPVSAVNVIADCIDFVCCSSSKHPWTAAHLESIHHALQLSPQACRAMANSSGDKETTTTTRTRRIRIRGENVQLNYQELQNPLWSPAMSLETPKPRGNNAAFWKLLIREKCILQTHDLKLSMAGMKLVCLVLPHMTDDVWPLLGPSADHETRQKKNIVIRLLNPDTDDDEDDKGNNETTEQYSFTKKHTSNDIEEWLSVCISTMVEFWNISRKDTTRYGFWTEPSVGGPVRQVMVTVLDLMEHCILQDSVLYTSNLAFACVYWLQSMLLSNSAHWLLSQMPTSQSTPEMWHRTCSAVAVMVKLSHAVVIHQEIEAEKEASPNDWNDIRDQCIRFIQGILRMVHSQRRDWDRQSAHKKPPSFSSLVTFEYSELYISIVTALLFVDTKATGLMVSEDVQCMLQHQMEEIKMDQQERDDQLFLSVMKQ